MGRINKLYVCIITSQVEERRSNWKTPLVHAVGSDRFEIKSISIYEIKIHKLSIIHMEGIFMDLKSIKSIIHPVPLGTNIPN